MWSDPIADMLTRIRNASRNRSEFVNVPRSKFKKAICHVLREEGYITEVQEIDDDKQGLLRLRLKYGPRGEHVINSLTRESKSGCRKYVAVDEIPSVLNGLGIAILSTSKGVKSDRRCREERLGGELICTVH